MSKEWTHEDYIMEKMPVQFDGSMRVMTLDNLHAICEEVAGVCHRYWIDESNEHRTFLCYSNPNEYGGENTIMGVYPSYKQLGTTFVVMDLLEVVWLGDWIDDGNNPFDKIEDHPKMWRDPLTDEWSTSFQHHDPRKE